MTGPRGPAPPMLWCNPHNRIAPDMQGCGEPPIKVVPGGGQPEFICHCYVVDLSNNPVIWERRLAGLDCM